LIRITIQDLQQTISFPADEDTLLCLVAGCSVNPASLGDLLMASNVYRPGIATALMADLMEFDKTLHRQGAGPIHAEISQAHAQGQALQLTFQVFDEVTRQEATQARACDLVLVDIPGHTIHAPEGLNIHASGEVRIRPGEGNTSPTVTYILPQGWTIQPW